MFKKMITRFVCIFLMGIIFITIAAGCEKNTEEVTLGTISTPSSIKSSTPTLTNKVTPTLATATPVSTEETIEPTTTPTLTQTQTPTPTKSPSPKVTTTPKVTVAPTIKPTVKPITKSVLDGLPKPNLKDERKRIIFPKANPAKVIYVIRPGIKGLDGKTVINSDEKLLLQSLQGIVAQREAQIYIGNAQDKFLKYAQGKYNLILDDGLNVRYVNNAGEIEKIKSDSTWLKNLSSIIDHYIGTGDIKGYVKMLYDERTYNQYKNQANQACTLAGINKWIIVSTKLSSAIKSKFPNLKVGRDLSVEKVSEYKIFKDNKDKLNLDLLIMQAPPRVEHLREYGIANKAGFYFYNSNTPDSQKDYVYRNLNTLAISMGWQQVDAMENGVQMGAGEDNSVDFASDRDVSILAADWCQNLSIWSSLPSKKVVQKETKKVAKDGEQVHYVTMLYSDGDNIQWMSGGGFANEFFLETPANKKEMPFGWTLTPNLIETLPQMIDYLYSNMTNNEHFVASVTGYAYNHPSRLSQTAKEQYARDTAKMMADANMDYVAIKGGTADNNAAYRAYAAQPEIKGGFIMYGEGSSDEGRILWLNKKPFVHDRIIFWQDDNYRHNPANMAKEIVKTNYYPRDKTKESGYSFIQVHCWSYKYNDIVQQFYNGIDKSKVKVVPPNEFMDLINKNVKR